MARRAASDATDDSLKENSRRAPVKDEKPTRTRKSMLRDNQRAQDEDDESENPPRRQGPRFRDRANTARVEELEDRDDEPQGPPKVKRRRRRL